MRRYWPTIFRPLCYLRTKLFDLWESSSLVSPCVLSFGYSRVHYFISLLNGLFNIPRRSLLWPFVILFIIFIRSPVAHSLCAYSYLMLFIILPLSPIRIFVLLLFIHSPIRFLPMRLFAHIFDDSFIEDLVMEYTPHFSAIPPS